MLRHRSHTKKDPGLASRGQSRRWRAARRERAHRKDSIRVLRQLRPILSVSTHRADVIPAASTFNPFLEDGSGCVVWHFAHPGGTHEVRWRHRGVLEEPCVGCVRRNATRPVGARYLTWIEIGAALGVAASTRDAGKHALHLDSRPPGAPAP